MAFEIAIDELGIGNDKVAYVTLPANKNAVIDAMDRAKIRGETFLRIASCDEIPELEAYEFEEEPTLDELNFLAKRIEEIAEDNTQILAYRALLHKPFDTVNEAINRTFNLETVPVYPCKNFYEYGEIVLDNELLEELREVPDEVYDLLDPEKVGRVMAERENGVFIDGYYIIADSYEPVLVYDDVLPEQMDDWIFRLEIAGNSTEKAEILTLPASEKTIAEIPERLGEKSLEDCSCVDFQSAIPQIDKRILDSAAICSLNLIAKEFSELSRENAAKCKAILQNSPCSDAREILNIMRNLDRYEFDNCINDFSEYGEKYLLKMLPKGFDKEVLSGIGSVEFTRNLLAANGCKFTDYGVISGIDGHLFSPIKTSEQEQKSDFTMGGIS
ncbi:MAG: antirestriction protein ArdA [Oscillospiraceae bacterium]